MDLIDKSQKTLYEKSKQTVKIWEHDFKKNNGRLPSKLDIKEASSEVRNAYKTYFLLKTAALEQSFMDIDGFHSDEENDCREAESITFNNAPEKGLEKVDPTSNKITWGSHLSNKTTETTVAKPAEVPPQLNLAFTRKLSVGSKIMKRNPRKSLSQVKSDPNINKIISSNSFNSMNSEPSPNESFNIIGRSPSNQEPDSPLEPSHCLYTLPTKISANKLTSIVPTNVTHNLINKTKDNNLRFQNIDMKWLDRVEMSARVNETTYAITTKIDLASDEDIIDNSDDESTTSSFHSVKKIKFSSEASNLRLNQCSISDINTIDTQVVEQVPKENVDSISQKFSEYSPICTISTSQSEPNENMPISTSEKNQVKVVDSALPEGSEPTPQSHQSRTDNNVENYSIKSDKKNFNTNFVKLNMKKKIYVRGKKTQTFAKYKKKMWRNKKKFLSQEDDSFNKICKTFQSDKLLPLDMYTAPEDEDCLISLDEAAGIKPEDRPTRIVKENEETCGEHIEEDEDDMTLAQLRTLLSKNKNVNEIKIEPAQKKTNRKVKTTNRKSVSKPKTVKQKFNSNDSFKSPQKKRTPQKRVKPNAREVKVRGKSDLKDKSEATSDRIPSTSFADDEWDNSHNSYEHLMDPEDDADLLIQTARLECMYNFKEVYPLYSLEEYGNLIDTPPEVFEGLRFFGHQSFKEGQEQTVMRILSGKSTLVTLSTGSGKSLCYQLPAFLFRRKYRCITLVVSPLISLMEDQIKLMPRILNAACLHGNQTKTVREKIMKALTSGEISILMISPETILSVDTSSGLGSILDQLPPIAFACLDEAHCLSQWSHNFRPSYLMVCRILRETLKVKTILGLTATATRKTTDSLIEQLEIPDGQKGVIKDTPVPPNLILTVSKDVSRDQALLGLLLSEPFVDFESIIIYCLRRKDCEEVAKFLRTTLQYQGCKKRNTKKKTISVQAEPYHAGLSAARRKSIQAAFMSGELRIVVATIAFGMGINKADLRSVIHYNMPAKFESYVQEIGRAGRDGLPAHCHVFLEREDKDVYELRRHIYGNSVDRHIIRKLLQKVFPICQCKDICPKHEVLFPIDATVQEFDTSPEIISTLLCYLELHEKSYIKVLKQSYGMCKIISYEGPALFTKTSSSSEPLKLALKLYQSKDNSNVLEFPVLDVAQRLKHDSGMLKNILKNLEWININGQPKRSGLTVEFSDLSFHLLSPGNLTDDELDAVLDLLYNKVLQQENTSYSQLVHINEVLSKAATPTYKNSLNDCGKTSEDLKQHIRDYFESSNIKQEITIPDVSPEVKNRILNDVRSIVSKYSDETFSGRSIARIFHGISSPNFSAFIWGRTKFWRSHLQVHFNIICRIATSELIKIQS